MAGMLQRLRGKDATEDFVRRVLAVSDNNGAAAPREAAGPTAAEPVPALAARTSPAGDRRPLEDLTNRELDILELLSQRLQNKEIAERLSISPQTVNYHLKHIYQKLEVSGRREAVDRALEQGILGPRSAGPSPL
jgi:LuxR family maltose regulon positive regulatory protein